MNAARRRLKFRMLAGEYAVCRLRAKAPVPKWAKGAFCSITRTAEELSIVCRARQVPSAVAADRGWHVLQLIGPFPFTAVGILASVAEALAGAGIGLLAIATYDTDYVLVKAKDGAAAVKVLVSVGHSRVR